MRAPFQILAIPYRVTPELQFCVFHRADIDQYQFVAGGGENDEKLLMQQFVRFVKRRQSTQIA